MKKIKKLAAIPDDSAILAGFGEVHFYDVWQIAKATDESAAEIAKELMRLPPWATALFKLRNAIVRVFGLKTGRTDAQFPIIFQSDNEAVMGLGDSHLDFRASIMKNQSESAISLTTVVHFNNIWGRIYFIPVKPFHKIIMKSLLKNYLKKQMP